jgi:hypothetical protein
MVHEFADFSSPELSESLIDSFLEVSPEDFRHDYRNEFKQGDGLPAESALAKALIFNETLSKHIAEVRSLLSIYHSENQLSVLADNLIFLEPIRYFLPSNLLYASILTVIIMHSCD